MHQALQQVTSARLQVTMLNDDVERTLIFEEVVDAEGPRSHTVFTIRDAQGLMQTQETIIVHDLKWEKQPDGTTWGSPQPITATVGGTDQMEAATLFANIEIRGKVGTVLTENRPTDIYWVRTYDGEGALHLDPKTCLPVLFSVSDEPRKKKYSMTSEWNVPVTITPPGP